MCGGDAVFLSNYVEHLLVLSDNNTLHQKHTPVTALLHFHHWRLSLSIYHRQDKGSHQPSCSTLFHRYLPHLQNDQNQLAQQQRTCSHRSQTVCRFEISSSSSYMAKPRTETAIASKPSVSTATFEHCRSAANVQKTERLPATDFWFSLLPRTSTSQNLLHQCATDLTLLATGPTQKQ